MTLHRRVRRGRLGSLVFSGLVAFLLLTNTDVLAQGPGTACCGQHYNAGTVATMSGVVDDVAYVAPAQQHHMGPGVHVMLQKDGEILPVHLGPYWYLSEQGKPFEKGEAVTVVGSRVTMAGETVLIAQTITRGDSTLVLRDDQGMPVWRGWRSGANPGQSMGPGHRRAEDAAGAGCPNCRRMQN